MENIRSLCVYCGSSGRVDPAYKQAARALGERMAKAGIEQGLIRLSIGLEDPQDLVDDLTRALNVSQK